jgi:predicted transcriptional regulator
MNPIKQLREQLGINVSELSRITNVSRFTIYRLESGKNANLGTTKKVLGYLLEKQIELNLATLKELKSTDKTRLVYQIELDILKTQHQNLISLCNTKQNKWHGI